MATQPIRLQEEPEVPKRKEELRTDVLPHSEIAAAVDELDHRHDGREGDAESNERGRTVESHRLDGRADAAAAIHRQPDDQVGHGHVHAVGHRRRKAAEGVRERDETDDPHRRPASAGYAGSQPEKGRIERRGVRDLPEEAHCQCPAGGEDDSSNGGAALAETFLAQPEVGKEEGDIELQKDDAAVHPRQRKQQRRQGDERRQYSGRR